MATLYRIKENGSKAEQWEIDENAVLVGRSGQANVNIEDEGLSRRHFLISRDGEDYVIKDLNSRNGTWVDGRRVFAARLRHNDCIRAGNSVFLFAEPHVLSARGGRGPHDTVIVAAASQPERRPSPSIAWQHDVGGNVLELAA